MSLQGDIEVLRDAGLKRIAARAPDGWQPIETLDHDHYVMGYSVYAAQSEDCPVQIYFIGRRFHREGRLLNEWTGKSRGITHWMPLPPAPVTA